MFFLIFLVLLCPYTESLTDVQLNQACLNLYSTAQLLGCQSSQIKSQVSLCDNFYQIQENDTCEYLADHLKISINILKGLVNCDSLQFGQIICVRVDTEEFSLSDLDLLISAGIDEKNETDFKVDFFEGLEAHNFHRVLHQASELEYNQTIAEMAQKWANHLASLEKLVHNYESPYGENLAQACGFKDVQDYTVSMATSAWYNEIKNYNFTTGKKIDETQDIGHFTQVVWKNTKQVGFGKALDQNGCIYIVANYFPPGNIRGRYVKNVLKMEEVKENE